VTGDKIARITPGGTITEFPLPTSGGDPEGITEGPDGNVWFTEFAGDKIGRITPQGTITEFPVPVPGAAPHQITAGPGDGLWFTEPQVTVLRLPRMLYGFTGATSWTGESSSPILCLPVRGPRSG
jgi:virginiamycin B lyase